MKNSTQELLDLLRIAPDHHLDRVIRLKISLLPAEIKSAHILEILDECIYSSLASSFAIAVFQQLYDMLLKQENIAHEQNLNIAHWRNK